LTELIRIVYADEMVWMSLGVTSPKSFWTRQYTIILAAAAARTSRIKLTSVTVLVPISSGLSGTTIDLISNGRAEIVTGREFILEAFPTLA
jgi:alkanesulfonate monooxygenase SsuD/methylene tetrahydromethanopterin reductase-like flavin-dependent oxidoreductase (luciferase family)